MNSRIRCEIMLLLKKRKIIKCPPPRSDKYFTHFTSIRQGEYSIFLFCFWKKDDCFNVGFNELFITKRLYMNLNEHILCTNCEEDKHQIWFPWTFKLSMFLFLPSLLHIWSYENTLKKGARSSDALALGASRHFLPASGRLMISKWE